MATDWYAQIGERVVGPITAAQLKRLVEEGEITSATLVKSGAGGEWASAELVKGLFSPQLELRSETARHDPAPRVPVKPLPSQMPPWEQGTTDPTELELPEEFFSFLDTPAPRANITVTNETELNGGSASIVAERIEESRGLRGIPLRWKVLYVVGSLLFLIGASQVGALPGLLAITWCESCQISSICLGPAVAASVFGVCVCAVGILLAWWVAHRFTGKDNVRNRDSKTTRAMERENSTWLIIFIIVAAGLGIPVVWVPTVPQAFLGLYGLVALTFFFGSPNCSLHSQDFSMA